VVDTRDLPFIQSDVLNVVTIKIRSSNSPPKPPQKKKKKKKKKKKEKKKRCPTLKPNLEVKINLKPLLFSVPNQI
jgi:hypothetical protein